MFESNVKKDAIRIAVPVTGVAVDFAIPAPEER
jgi:hypothetical protein